MHASSFLSRLHPPRSTLQRNPAARQISNDRWTDPIPGPLMFDWLRKRRLSAEAKRKLLIVAARSEEALVETHVANVLELLQALAPEVDVDRALELYAEVLPMDEHQLAMVTNRVLARHDQPPPRPAVRTMTERRFQDVFRDRR